MKKLEFRPLIRAKYLPITNYKPARFSIYIREKHVATKSVHSVKDDYPYTAQAIIEKYLKENGYNWKLANCSVIGNTFYFITE